VHPKEQASYGKSEAIIRDAADPDFQSMLKTVGAVQIPDAARDFDTQHMKNPQLRTLSRRQQLADDQLEESTNPATRSKRSWVEVGTIQEILRLRDEQGWEPEKIEKQLGLAKGVVGRLGKHVSLAYQET